MADPTATAAGPARPRKGLQVVAGFLFLMALLCGWATIGGLIWLLEPPDGGAGRASAFAVGAGGLTLGLIAAAYALARRV